MHLRFLCLLLSLYSACAVPVYSHYRVVPSVRSTTGRPIQSSTTGNFVLSLISGCFFAGTATSVVLPEIAPSALNCSAGLQQITTQQITQALFPCALLINNVCCNGVNSIFKFGFGTPLEGCLCNELFLSEVVRLTEENNLSSLIGFGEARLLFT